MSEAEIRDERNVKYSWRIASYGVRQHSSSPDSLPLVFVRSLLDVCKERNRVSSTSLGSKWFTKKLICQFCSNPWIGGQYTLKLRVHSKIRQIASILEKQKTGASLKKYEKYLLRHSKNPLTMKCGICKKINFCNHAQRATEQPISNIHVNGARSNISKLHDTFNNVQKKDKRTQSITHQKHNPKKTIKETSIPKKSFTQLKVGAEAMNYAKLKKKHSKLSYILRQTSNDAKPCNVKTLNGFLKNL